MKHKRVILFGTLLGVGLLLGLVGCGSEAGGPEPATSAGSAAAPAAVPAHEVAKKIPPLPPPPPPPPSEVTPPKPRDPSEPPPGMVREKADAGSGAAGRDYGKEVVAGPITVPISAYFKTRNRVVFEIQIPKTMQLYKATEGHAPRTEQEFMQKIIKENDIRLPELPPGHRYVYDPAKEELMVERPQ